MDIGEKDFEVAACAEEMGDLDHGDEIAAVWAASCCGAWEGEVSMVGFGRESKILLTPVDAQRAVLFDYHIF